MQVQIDKSTAIPEALMGPLHDVHRRLHMIGLAVAGAQEYGDDFGGITQDSLVASITEAESILGEVLYAD
jgi:hypothetical protein